MEKIIALLDCNNFYASCERTFNPALNGKPIVILSNNDGCIIARSNEAKALGIPMGEPYFKAKHIIENNNVKVFSSNYTLYGDMSARVMATLAEFVKDIEIYSIDEAFVDLTNYPEPEKLAKTIRQAVGQWTGIPVMDRDVARQLIPDMDRRRSPFSDYLLSLLKKPLESLFANENQFVLAFDEFEYLWCLLHVDAEKQRGGPVWAPYGAFIWRRHNRYEEWLPQQIEKVIQNSDKFWPHLKAGLFGGSIERLSTAYQEAKPILDTIVLILLHIGC